jgi:hypothetical protein
MAKLPLVPLLLLNWIIDPVGRNRGHIPIKARPNFLACDDSPVSV